LNSIVDEKEDACGVSNGRMIKAIDDPGPKGAYVEEFTALSLYIELGISIEQAGANELIKDADCERRKNGEDDVVEC